MQPPVTKGNSPPRRQHLAEELQELLRKQQKQINLYIVLTGLSVMAVIIVGVTFYLFRSYSSVTVIGAGLSLAGMIMGGISLLRQFLYLRRRNAVFRSMIVNLEKEEQQVDAAQQLVEVARMMYLK